MQTIFIAPDIECEGCAASIQKALGRENGVTQVAVAVPIKTITVQYEESRTNSAALAEALTDLGFPPQMSSDTGTQPVVLGIEKA